MATPIWGDQPPLVYFAEPIDKAAGKNFKTAAEMVGALHTWGCGIYRPSTAWRNTKPDPRVEQINRTALYQADAIVAYLDEHTPSIGVPAEIEAATARKIPAVVHYTGASFALAGNPLVTVINDTNNLIAALEKALKDHPRQPVVTGDAAHDLLYHSPIYRLPFTTEELDEQLQLGAIANRAAGLFTHQFKPRDEPPWDLYRNFMDMVRKVNANKRYGPADMNPIRLVLADGTQAPTRAYPDDAGVDLTTARETIIEPGQYVDIHTQVEATELPTGYWGLITGRSSALRKWRLHIPMAIIDPGWRGPLFVGVWNLGGNPVTVRPGDRLGQLILIPNNPAAIEIVQAVSDHPRGLKGFGSSG